MTMQQGISKLIWYTLGWV